MDTVMGIGLVMIIGFLGGRLASAIRLPSLTGYLVFGLLFGPYVMGVIPRDLVVTLKDPVSLIAISVIAFMLGGDLTVRAVAESGPKTLGVAAVDSVVTFGTVFAGLWLLAREQPYIALPLAALAASPAPTVIVPIVKELKAKGRFTETLLMVSALEDVTWSPA